MIIAGTMMMLGSVIFFFLVVIHIIASDLLLLFAVYAVSVSGLFLGIIGVAQYVQTNKKVGKFDK